MTDLPESLPVSTKLGTMLYNMVKFIDGLDADNPMVNLCKQEGFKQFKAELAKRDIGNFVFVDVEINAIDELLFQVDSDQYGEEYLTITYRELSK